MPKCSVKNCANDSRRKNERVIRYFRFPHDSIYINTWIKACGQSVNVKTGELKL